MASTAATGGVLVTKGKAGLGNRLLAVLGSLMYCGLSGRAMYVDWTDGTYAEGRENAFEFAFALKGVPLAGPEALGGDVFPPLWQGSLDKSITEMIDEHDPSFWNDEMAVHGRYSVAMRDIRRPEPVVVRWSYFDDFANCFKLMGYKWFSLGLRRRLLGDLLRRHVELAPAIAAEVDAVAARVLTRPTIGVHIRYTDNKAPYELLAAELDRLARRHPDAAIFLATDNKNVARGMAMKYRDRLITLDKMMPADGTPLHHMFKSKQGFKEVLLDMLMLSRCQWLVYSSASSLGFCASLLSRAPEADQRDCRRLGQRLRAAVKTLYINLRAAFRPGHGGVGLD